MDITYINFSKKEIAEKASKKLLESGLVYCIDLLPVQTMFFSNNKIVKENSHSLIFYSEDKNIKNINELLNDYIDEDCGESKSKVVVGGTFDLFHKGHETLLKEAFSLGTTFIGLTSDKMAKERKNRKIEPYIKRKAKLEYFAKKEGADIRIKMIENEVGFTLDDNFDYIIVSEETEKNADKINKLRKEKGMSKIKTKKISLVVAEDKKPISSTRIFNKEIDRDGKKM